MQISGSSYNSNVINHEHDRDFDSLVIKIRSRYERFKETFQEEFGREYPGAEYDYKSKTNGNNDKDGLEKMMIDNRPIAYEEQEIKKDHKDLDAVETITQIVIRRPDGTTETFRTTDSPNLDSNTNWNTASPSSKKKNRSKEETDSSSNNDIDRELENEDDIAAREPTYGNSSSCGEMDENREEENEQDEEKQDMTDVSNDIEDSNKIQLKDLQQRMEDAAAAKDYISAGKLQQEIKDIENHQDPKKADLERRIEDAVKEKNYILAGKLQEALNEHQKTTTTTTKAAPAPAPAPAPALAPASCDDDINDIALSLRELKAILAARGVDYAGFVEKSEFVDKVKETNPN